MTKHAALFPFLGFMRWRYTDLSARIIFIFYYLTFISNLRNEYFNH